MNATVKLRSFGRRNPIRWRLESEPCAGFEWASPEQVRPRRLSAVEDQARKAYDTITHLGELRIREALFLKESHVGTRLSHGSGEKKKWRSNLAMHQPGSPPGFTTLGVSVMACACDGLHRTSFRTEHRSAALCACR